MLSPEFISGLFFAACQRLPTNIELAQIQACASTELEAIHLVRRLPEATRFFDAFYGLSCNWISPLLCIGEFPGPFQADLMAESGINAFVNVSGKDPVYQKFLEKNVSYVSIPLVNNAPNDVACIKAAAQEVLRLMGDAKRVYLHCFSGISRSALVASIVVAVSAKCSFYDGMRFVKSRRPMARPNPDLLSNEMACQIVKELS
jgi:hypothetical protein